MNENSRLLSFGLTRLLDGENPERNAPDAEMHATGIFDDYDETIANHVTDGIDRVLYEHL